MSAQPAIPVASLSFATNTDYAAGSEIGNPTKVEPVSGRKADGWSPETKPSPQQTNWLMNAIVLWLQWLVANTAVVRHRFPVPFYSSGFSIANSFGGFAPYGSTYTDPVSSVGFPLGALGVDGDGPGLAQIDLDVPEGFTLTELQLNLVAQGAGCTTNLSVIRTLNGDSTVSLLGEISVTTPTTAADVTMNFAAESDGLSVTVTTGAGNVVYTRSAGSYITDGFFVGQIVDWSGFVNAGNNQTITITALTALAMTALIGTGTPETGPMTGSNVAGVAPVADGTGEIQLVIYMVNVGGNSAACKDLRTTIAPA